MPDEWLDSFIISLLKDKVDASEKGDYCGLKLTEHVLTVTERIIEDIIHCAKKVDDMQARFITGRGATDMLFIVK